MANELDDAVEQMVNSGLHQSAPDEIVRRLDAELQQQTEASAMVLSGAEPEAWVLGGAQAGGFGSMAQRFLNYYSTALHREICDPAGGGLTQKYQSLLGGEDLKSQIKTLAPVVLAALGVSATLVAPATVAAIVATWLLRVGLAQWCAAPPPAAPSDAGSSATSAPAAPAAPAASSDAGSSAASAPAASAAPSDAGADPPAPPSA